MSTQATIEELFAEINRPPTFTRRPDPIPGDLRIVWRLSALTMILSRCRADSASLVQLSVIYWAMRAPETRERFLKWFQGDSLPEEVLVRYDPALNSTVDLALGLQLIERTESGVLRLTTLGKVTAADVWASTGALEQEKEFLLLLPKRMTQKMVTTLLASDIL